MVGQGKDTTPATRRTAKKPAAAPSKAPAPERPQEEGEPELYDRVKQRAYEIWEREGRPEGREEEHWQRAEREILQEMAAGPAGTAAASKRKSTKTRS